MNTGDPFSTRRVSLAERGLWVRDLSRRAAVAFPVIDHPSWGLCTAATVRAAVNGFTGRRMSHAGDVVLFGGAIEPDETPEDAALRELCEESNTLNHLGDPDYSVRHHLGDWITESGVRVHGFLVDLPATFVDDATPDPREVSSIGFLHLDRLFRHPPAPRYHHVDKRDDRTEGLPEQVLFESPTIDLIDTRTGEPWSLWGAAGQMAALARDHLLTSGSRAVATSENPPDP